MLKNKYLDRISFEKIDTPIEIPDLLEIQINSYKKFLQIDDLPEKRKNIGIEAVFKSVFPISDFKETAILDYDSYILGDWSCKCRDLEGIENSKPYCTECGSVLEEEIKVNGFLICPECESKNTIKYNTCEKCGDRVRLKIKKTPEECLDKGFDYAVPLKVKLRLAVYDTNKDGKKVIKDVKEQEIFFGEIPYITDRGTFIINGTERVVVSQLQRSPGVYFLAGKLRGEYKAKVIPARGAWIEFEEKNNLLQIRLDKKTKRINITTFLKAMGLFDDIEILKSFYRILDVKVSNGTFLINTSRFLKGATVTDEVVDKKGKTLVPKNSKLLLKTINDLKKNNIKHLPIDLGSLEEVYSAMDLEDCLKLNEKITPTQIKKLKKLDTQFQIFFPESEEEEYGPMIANTLRKDKKRKDIEITDKVVIQSGDESDIKISKNQGDAYIEIFKKLRPGEPVTLEGSKKFFENMMLNPNRYDLSSVGRLKLNIKLNRREDYKKDEILLTIEDIIEILRYFLRLKYDRTGTMKVDDIDHLSNRRIRAVGELVENAFRIGIARLERVIKERITNAQDLSTMLPRELLNTKPVFAAIKEFFGTSQLSQFMDQTNPLSETTHKRRISALGPGGLNRERAGFEVRDVHSSHYGRICPIETPEGPNIGLIASLTTFAKVNDYGFIETPFRKVEGSQIQDYYRINYSGDSKFKFGQIVRKDELDKETQALKKSKKETPVVEYHPFYLTAWQEEGYFIAQANAKVDENRKFKTKKVNARCGSETVLAEPKEINYMDISPKQIVSVSASLIPFLEHDDANRALMGSNMQRQAVPLVKPETPIVGTGIEFKLVKDSGNIIKCKRDGVVKNVDARRIIVKADIDENNDFSEICADIYELKKYRRSNQNTLVNQKPLVNIGDRVGKNQILCDGPGTERGELALGSNILAAFLPWRGYNFEDAIILSERLVRASTFDSIYIVEESIEVRETKLGKEEVTQDIPGVPEKSLKHLDENGIVRIGAKVIPGDILVGKVTPKGESQLTPEEKLLKAIFGEQAAEIKDTSLYCPPGVEGTVIDVKIFNRRGMEIDNRIEDIHNLEIQTLERNFNDEKAILVQDKFEKLKSLFNNTKASSKINLKDIVVSKGKNIELGRDYELDEKKLTTVKKALTKDALKAVKQIETRTKLHIEALRN